MFDTVCNAARESLRSAAPSDVAIAGPLTFHHLARIVAGSCTIIAIAVCFYLIFMHAIYYTKRVEQKHTIRLLSFIPFYSALSFLQVWYPRLALYFQLAADCYAAFALATFIVLVRYYIAQDYIDQSEYFNLVTPIQPWVAPLGWLPIGVSKTGGTWFNVIRFGVGQYCFVRIGLSVASVVLQEVGLYCETSNSPLFGHVWISSIYFLTTLVALYFLVQLYVQLREALMDHRPALKLTMISLLILLPPCEMSAYSLATTAHLSIVEAIPALTYPDIIVSIPRTLICIQMSILALLALWSFSYRPYAPGATPCYYPCPDPRKPSLLPTRENRRENPAGGTMGVGALLDAANITDCFRALARTVVSPFSTSEGGKGAPHLGRGTGREMGMYAEPVPRANPHLPIAEEFRRSRFGLPAMPGDPFVREERAGLIAYAQPNPVAGALSPLSPRHYHPHGFTPSPRDTPSPISYRDFHYPGTPTRSGSGASFRGPSPMTDASSGGGRDLTRGRSAWGS